MSTLSVVLSIRNESSKLEKVLSKLDFADELIIVDNESTDASIDIAKKFTNKIYRQKNNVMLNVNKNFGFDKAKSDWILNLDGDEEITDELIGEIKEKIENRDINGYWLPRKNIIFGKWIKHGLWWPDKQLRLFRRDKGRFPCLHVHEYISIEGNTSETVNYFIHHNYEKISQYIRKLNDIYSENEVEKYKSIKFSWLLMIREPIQDFLSVYFLRSGWKDGLHGLVLALLQAYYAFIVLLKVWEQSGFKEEQIDIALLTKELNMQRNNYFYWFFTSKLSSKNSVLLNIYYRCRRFIRR